MAPEKVVETKLWAETEYYRKRCTELKSRLKSMHDEIKRLADEEKRLDDEEKRLAKENEWLKSAVHAWKDLKAQKQL